MLKERSFPRFISFCFVPHHHIPDASYFSQSGWARPAPKPSWIHYSRTKNNAAPPGRRRGHFGQKQRTRKRNYTRHPRLITSCANGANEKHFPANLDSFTRTFASFAPLICDRFDLHSNRAGRGGGQIRGGAGGSRRSFASSSLKQRAFLKKQLFRQIKRAKGTLRLRLHGSFLLMAIFGRLQICLA